MPSAPTPHLQDRHPSKALALEKRISIPVLGRGSIDRVHIPIHHPTLGRHELSVHHIREASSTDQPHQPDDGEVDVHPQYISVV